MASPVDQAIDTAMMPETGTGAGPDPSQLTILARPFIKRPGVSSVSAVHDLLRTAYPEHDWRLGRQANGRPLLERCDWQLSVSHSAGLLVVVLSNSPCGLDLEYVRDQRRWRRLYDWITHPEERLAQPEAADFLKAWTAKEALLKARGLGLEEGLDRQRVPTFWPGCNRWLLTPERSFWIRHFNYSKELLLCLVSDRPKPICWYSARSAFRGDS